MRTGRIIAVGLLLLAATAARAARADDGPALCTDASRACLTQTARAYFDAIMRADARAVPFASDVRVTEQGRVVATTRAAFLQEFRSTGATKGLRNLRMIVDTDAGQVAVMVLGDVRMADTSPFTVRRIQRMRIARGLIREVEIVLYRDDRSAAVLWPD